MLRRIVVTLVPSVALFTLALACVTAPRIRAGLAHRAITAVPAAQLAARSGYIVASS